MLCCTLLSTREDQGSTLGILILQVERECIHICPVVKDTSQRLVHTYHAKSDGWPEEREREKDGIDWLERCRII